MTRGQACRSAFLAGYRVGYRAGATAGRRQANQEWTDLTTAACRTALAAGAVTYAELERRRRQYPRVALTAAEIRDRARASWGLVETGVAR